MIKKEGILSDVIKLLTDAVANQIAAGEVVQRPSSAVKELLENSLDAGSTQIKLLIKDGGSTLIQVIDNGKGMSETDARMCWERHATSKIRKAEDLFDLSTYGFRGEAMASIAAVAQIEMKTRRPTDDVATFIRIEGSEVLEQRIDQSPVGTSISIKNLFYNIPARRNFLKSIAVETKHIYEEFQRQAMANPEVHFLLFNNNQEIFNWSPKSLLSRLADCIGKKDISDFLETSESTEIVSIKGFVGSPKLSKKTRGDQYFFVNDRFIKSPYFHHAVMQAFEGIIESDSFPTYCLFLEVPKDKLDVNVHPTKTEVKFEEEKHIYNVIKAAVRKSLGNFIVQPSAEILGLGNLNSNLGFQNFKSDVSWTNFNAPSSEKQDQRYNPFNQSQKPYDRNTSQDWQKILGPIDSIDSFERTIETENPKFEELIPKRSAEITLQGWFNLGDKYFVCNIENVIYIVDRKLAVQQLYYHQFYKQLEQMKGQSQQLLFPRTIELSTSHIAVVLEIMDDLKHLGFDLGHFGGNSLIVNGLPSQISTIDEQKVIEEIIEDYLNTQGDVKLSKYQSLALSLARKSSMYDQSFTSADQVRYLIQELLLIPNSQFTFDNKLVYAILTSESIFDLFKRQRQI